MKQVQETYILILYQDMSGLISFTQILAKWEFMQKKFKYNDEYKKELLDCIEKLRRILNKRIPKRNPLFCMYWLTSNE